MGRFVHEACARRPQDRNRLHDRGQRSRRLLPLHPQSPGPAPSRRQAADALRQRPLQVRHRHRAEGRQEAALRVGDDRRSGSRGRRAPFDPRLRPGPRTRAPPGSWASRVPRGARAASGSRPARPATSIAVRSGATRRRRTIKHGTLELMFESSNRNHLDQPDAIVVSPRGGVLLCEDGDGEDLDNGTNNLRVLTPAGKMETFLINRRRSTCTAGRARRRGGSAAANGRAPASAPTASGCSSTSRSPASPTPSPVPGRRVGRRQANRGRLAGLGRAR